MNIYKQLIDNLNYNEVIQLMIKFGADRYIEKEKYIIFPTICHNTKASEASMKLYFYKDSKMFYCYTNCEALSIFRLLEHYYECRQIEYDWYTDIYQVIENCSDFKIKISEIEEKPEAIKDKYSYAHLLRLPQFDEKIMDIFEDFYTEEWKNDGISIESMKKYNIKFSISQNKIIIPHYDINNRLIGIRGRALDPWEVENVGKYLPLKIEKQRFSHPLSLNLYGLNISKNNIQETGVCYVFESEKSCMQLDGFNIKNCSVAACGSNFNKLQLKLLLKYCHPKEIIICFDKEEKNGEEKYFKKLYHLCEKYSNYCNFSFIYDRDNLLDLKDSPTDKGETIFMKLLERRVKVRK